MFRLPSALPSPKKYTNFFAFGLWALGFGDEAVDLLLDRFASFFLAMNETTP
jgi:hypothetical protein